MLTYIKSAQEKFEQNNEDIDCLKAKAKPVKIVAVRAELDYGSWHYECPVCNGYVDAHDKFCRHCGVPLEV